MRAPRLVVALSLAAALAGCSAATHDQGQPSGDVPTETVTVYLAVAKACSISDGDATFSPLLVEGDGYSTTIGQVASWWTPPHSPHESAVQSRHATDLR